MARKMSSVAPVDPWGALPEPSDRYGWQMLTALVGLAGVTGQIIGEQPESLLVVGPSGSGKTAILGRYHFPTGDPRNPHLMHTTNLSAWGLQGILKIDVPRGITHLVIPEMQTLMLRKSGVWQGLHGLLLPAMEEGVGIIRNGPENLDLGGARLGLIGAITHDSFLRNRSELMSSGFLSRVLVVYWMRSIDDVLKSQLRYSAGDKAELEPIHVEFRGRQNVAITREADNGVIDLAHSYDAGNAYRAARRFRALAKAIAYTNGESIASRIHVEALASFAPLWQEP